MSIVNKIPKLEQIAPVYALIVVMIYPWTLMRLFWKLPSWILFASIGDLVVIFAYMVAVNFLESILVLFAPLGINLILPQKWFYDRFESRSVSLVLFGLGYLTYLKNQLSVDAPFPLTLVRWLPAAFVAILVLVFLVDRVAFLRQALVALATRLTVFLYLVVPISILSLLVVLFRNIF